MMTMNIAEVLNNCIQKARRLPITTAMKFLKDILQRWFNGRREQARKNSTYLGKAAVGHCKERNEWSLTYNVYPIELTVYLVKDGKHDGLVDIEHCTYTCHNWGLDQLPCDHAIAVARFTKTNFNSLYHEYYNTSWMQTAYALAINPILHPSVWEVPDEVGSVIVLPPNSKRQAGRLKERRIPSAGEVRRQKKCSNCGEQCHNRMGCPNPRWQPNNGQLNTSISVEQPTQPTPMTRRQCACSVCHVLGHNRKTCPLVEHSLPMTGTLTDGDTTHL
ncbi:hypothetical protein Ddye_014498 [Dipteronia dyeriana]|uniref:SWIM-type domain-containing protein n=1 Tax=Dipteronia dyeriana TaxID=168575 RepID=A0AAE0CKM2_9ROSI|nr:hypothetical protein Ddye_014498 [Dipteronia dyeriana]